MSLRTDLAQHIRHVDGDNELSPYLLSWEIAKFLPIAPGGTISGQLMTYVQRINAKKDVEPDFLAECIVTDFQLDTEA